MNLALLFEGIEIGFSADYLGQIYPYIITILGGLFFPYFFGSSAWAAHWSPYNYVEWYSFFGYLQIAFVTGLILTRKNRIEKFILFIFIITLLTNALIPPFYHIFVFFIPSSGQVRLLYIFSFFGSILLAFAIDKFLNRREESRDLWKWLIFPSIITFISLAFLAWIIIDPIGMHRLVVLETGFLGVHAFYKVMWESGGQAPAPDMPWEFFTQYQLMHFSVAFLLALGAVLYFVKFPKIENKILFYLLLFLNLAYYGINYNAVISEKYIYPDTETTAWLRDNIGDGRLLRTGPDNFLPSSVISVLGIPDAATRVKSVAPLRNYRVFSFLDPGMPNNPITGIVPFSNPDILGKRIIDAMNVKYVATSTPWSQEQLESLDWYSQVWHDESITVYENARRLPRAYLVHNAVSLNEVLDRYKKGEYSELVDNMKLAKQLNGSRFFEQISLPDKVSLAYVTSDGFNPNTGALVEGTKSISDPHRTKPVPIKYERVSNHEFRFLIPEIKTPAYLYVADSFFPGWTAHMGSEILPIYPANFTFRAVYLKPGQKREVVMKYTPEGYYTGAVISVLALIIISSFATWLIYRGRRIDWRKQAQ